MLKRQIVKWNGSKQFCRAICVLSFVMASPVAISEVHKESGKNCAQFNQLAAANKLKKYSIPFIETGPDSWTYELGKNTNLSGRKLTANCGHGADAICEMALTKDGRVQFEFAVPTGIRVIAYRNGVYIITGVTYEASGTAEINNFDVFALRKNKAESICK